MERYLVVNADDLGLSVGVNQGIARAWQEGIVTSASLMVRAVAAHHALQVAGDIDLGLHLDLGEWAYRDGQWDAVYVRAPLVNPRAVEREAVSQLSLFRQLTGRDPTHVDSHQHLHAQEPLRRIAKKIAAECNVPLRGFAAIRQCGGFYGQTGKGAPYVAGISVDNLISILRDLPPGITELGCHPGEDAALASCYRLERFVEVETLCDDTVRRTIEVEAIRLITFQDIRNGTAGRSNDCKPNVPA